MTHEQIGTVIVFATFRPKPGRESDVQHVLQKVITPTREEPGCVRFDLFRSTGTPATFHLYEIFTSPAAIEAHRGTAHYREYRASIEPLLDTLPVAVPVAPVDVVPNGQ